MKLRFLTACLLILSAVGLYGCDDEKSISFDKLPQTAQQFVHQYFPTQNTVRITREKDDGRKNYEVTLDNGASIDFDESGHGHISKASSPRCRSDFCLRPCKPTSASGIRTLRYMKSTPSRAVTKSKSTTEKRSGIPPTARSSGKNSPASTKNGSSGIDEGRHVSRKHAGPFHNRAAADQFAIEWSCGNFSPLQAFCEVHFSAGAVQNGSSSGNPSARKPVVQR